MIISQLKKKKYSFSNTALPHPQAQVTLSFREGWLTTGQESFSLSQMNVSQCNHTLDSLGMFWNRKALNWKVALCSFPFSCTRTVSSVGQLEHMGWGEGRGGDKVAS